jgi:flagellar biogenesis protein FliO
MGRSGIEVRSGTETEGVVLMKEIKFDLGKFVFALIIVLLAGYGFVTFVELVWRSIFG